MKLKKKVKRNIIILIAIVVLCFIGYQIYKHINNDQTASEVKIVNTIKEYGYNLKDSKTKEYESMFKELKKILEEDEVDEEKYVKQISKMFIYDFYSLADKTAKTDIGGTDFVYTPILNNFITNAQSTYYKYVESNIYNQREQELPTVSEVEIDSIDNISYEYEDETDENAYEVKVNWTYTSNNFNDYQQEATLTFIHEGNKLSLAELN